MEGRYVTIVLPGVRRILTLCEVEVYGGNMKRHFFQNRGIMPSSEETLPNKEVVTEDHNRKMNVALRGSAVQSSTYGQGVAERAIDGSRKSNYGRGSCSHTDGGTNSWWRVDLLDTYAITSITITNSDAIPAWINGAEIRIGNSLENHGNSNPRCAVISSIPAGGTTTFWCSEMKGRYVNVFLRGYQKYLTLCEVEVYAHPVPIDIRPTEIPEQDLVPLKLENKALGKPAEQSSGYTFNGNASYAVDGKRLSWYKDQSCSHTRIQANPWWRVDLEEKYNITSVTITNIEQVNPEMIDGAEIRIGNSLENNGNSNPLCAVISPYPAWKVMTFQCRGMEGHYVNIFLPGCNKHLALCEVEVNVGGHPDDEFVPPISKTDSGNRMTENLRGQGILCQDSKTPYANVATGGTATQSTQYDDKGGASNAIDLNRGNDYMDGSCTHTRAERDPWWRVDLTESHNVTYVSVTNRGDCCSERISGAEIHVGDSLVNNGNGNPLCAVIPYIPLGQTRTFPCGGMEGRYVNILLPGNEKYLTLCEVEVHASTFTPVMPSASPMLTLSQFLTGLLEFMLIRKPPAVHRANVALMGNATQSSQFDHLTHANNAIDGRQNRMYRSGSCIHTRLQSDPWWRVDLMTVHNVITVRVTGMNDCCPWRLDGAQILVGNSLKNNGNSNPVCGVISAGTPVTHQCNGMPGRYVNIFLPGCSKVISMCEVEVYAVPFHDADKSDHSKEEEEAIHDESFETHCQGDLIPENLASAGLASQSSQYNFLGAASNAIDRKRDPVYYSGSCTHTNEETNPWWRVDLLDTYIITSVAITNRGDCCAHRISGAKIRIGNDLDGTNNPLCAVIPEMVAGQTIEFSCKEMEGRYVTVVLPGPRRILTVCEVEVYGGNMRRRFFPNRGENVALRGKATQSNRLEGEWGDFSNANNAIDGNGNAHYHAGSCSHTKIETNPWWRVDLLDTYIVTAVTITNRGDCCPQRINGAEVRIGNSVLQYGTENPLAGVISSIPAGGSLTLTLNSGMNGRYVTVVLPGTNKILTLCEVEVYGYRAPTGVL